MTKNIKKIIFVLLAALCLGACHEPEYVQPKSQRQGLTSITAIISSGVYANQELSKLTIDEAMFQSGELVMEIPYYYPETSEEGTLGYMTALRVQAELQPNYSIEPGLGLMDLTETRNFTLHCPDGTSRAFSLIAKRVKPKACSLVTFLVNDFMVSGVIYEDQEKVLIPYLNDLSSVSVSGQVSPHATLSSINGKTWTAEGKYNLNTGATITVLAGNGTTSKTYNVEQGIPELESSGMNVSSIKTLFSVDAASVAGLPPYTELAYVSLAGIGSNIVVGLGSGKTPVYLDAYTGKNLGSINLGAAVADALTNDEGGNVLMVNFAQGGESAETVKIYRTSSVTEAPTLFYSFVNPCTEPVGHRIKVMGDIDANAVIVLTAEGVAEVTLTAKAVVLYVENGSVATVEVEDFASCVGGWGDAPINFATVIPASATPKTDGWYLNYYEGNCDDDGLYLLHYIDAAKGDKIIARNGNWGTNTNCLDIKTFNKVNYMTMFFVSHFPNWGIGPMIYLFDASDPSSPSKILENEALPWTQAGAYDPATGASGDVAMYVSEDGYRLFVHYYDHHSQAIASMVADCFKK